MKKHAKIPVILYESEEQSFPYIEVKENESMPEALFIQEYRHTGEFEPGPDGEEQPIVDMMIHMYANMSVLAEKLTPELYDQVRVSIGLQPVKKARKEGQKVLDKVYGNINKHHQEAHDNKDNLKDELSRRLNEKLNEKFFETKAEAEENQDNKKEEGK